MKHKIAILAVVVAIAVSFLNNQADAEKQSVLPKLITHRTLSLEKFNQEQLELTQSEKALEQAGLRFKTKLELGGKRTVEWDMDLFKRKYLLTDITDQEIAEQLQTYIEETQSYLKKYRKPIRIKNADGVEQEFELSDEDRAMLDAKIMTAEESLDKI